MPAVPEVPSTGSLFEEHPDGRVADGGIAHRGTGSDQTDGPNLGVPTDNG
jgi:hypothetical protein